MTCFFMLFAGLSLASVALGCWAAATSGAPSGVWTRNLLAWAIGALCAGALARWTGRRTLLGVLLLAPAGLIASLANTGQLGVHRWVDIGPLHMNAAEVVLPSAVVACAALAAGKDRLWLSAAIAMALLAVQPDASQASALGAAWLVIIALAPMGGAQRGAAAVFAVAAMAWSWLRADPLAPVADVEGIMELAWRLSPLAGIAAWAVLIGAVSTPLIHSRSEAPALRAAAVALALYGLFSVLTTRVGAFPVPLVGMGMSSILGLWLGVGLLAALPRAPRWAASP